MKNIFGGLTQALQAIVFIAVFVLSVVVAPQVQAISRPFIYSQQFVISEGDAVLKIYGNNFSSSFYEPQVLFNNSLIPVLYANDSVIRAQAPLPLAIGEYEVHVLIGSRASNTRMVDFRAIDQEIIDSNREMLGITPVNWSLVQLSEPIVEESSEEVMVAETDPQEVAVSIAYVEDVPSKEVEKQYVAITEEEIAMPDVEAIFSDLNTVPWVKTYLPSLFRDGIINGYSDSTFRPWATVSRVEALKMMMEALEVQSDFNFQTSSYADISLDTWQHSYVELARAFGILTTGEGMFYPDRPITRLEVLTALLELDKVYNGRSYNREDSFEFFDLDLSQNRSISPFVLMQVINRDEKFRPFDSLTRAEWTKILSLYLERRHFDDFVDHIIRF